MTQGNDNYWNRMRERGILANAEQFSTDSVALKEDRPRTKQEEAFWKKEFRLKAGTPMGEKAIFRFVPGEYPVPPHVVRDYPQFDGLVLPYHTRIEYKHFNRGGTYGVMVPDTTDQENGQDLSLYLRDQGEKVTPRLVRYYNVIEMGIWHKVPVQRQYTAKDGSKKVADEIEWQRCTGKNCQLCAQGLEKIPGRMGYFAPNESTVAFLDDVSREIGQFCLCGCQTPLRCVQAVCSACGTVLEESEIDQRTQEPLSISPSTVQKLYRKFRSCPNCNVPLRYNGQYYIAESLMCDNCDKPTRATLYDAEIAVVKKGKGTETRVHLDRDLFSGRGFRVRPYVGPNVEVFDFHKDLPASLKYVARRLELRDHENPYYGEPEGAEPF